MRKLLTFVLVLAAIYGGYWVVGSRAVTWGLNAWAESLRGQGMEVAYSDLSTRGFPSRFDTTITDLRLGDPAAGWTWRAPFFQILALSYNPQSIIAVWPHEQFLDTGPGTARLATEDMKASVAFRPGPAFLLDHAALVLARPALSAPGLALSAEALRLAVRADKALPNGQDLGFEVLGLVPDKAASALIDPAGRMPAAIDRLRADIAFGLTAPLDRHAVEAAPPQITYIDLRQVELAWGQLGAEARGLLTAGADGILSGRIDISLRNWRDAIALAVDTGLVLPGMGETLTRLGEELTATAADKTRVDLPLTLQAGIVFLGPVPIGAAPPVTLR